MEDRLVATVQPQIGRLQEAQAAFAAMAALPSLADALSAAAAQPAEQKEVVDRELRAKADTLRASGKQLLDSIQRANAAQAAGGPPAFRLPPLPRFRRQLRRTIWRPS